MGQVVDSGHVGQGHKASATHADGASGQTIAKIVDAEPERDERGRLAKLAEQALSDDPPWRQRRRAVLVLDSGQPLASNVRLPAPKRPCGTNQGQASSLAP